MAETSFDIFLSYRRKDQPEVVELATLLKDRGLKVWLDKWELIAGQPWQEALEVIVEQTKSAAVCVGFDGIGPWQEREMRALLSEFVDRRLSVIPVLLPNAPKKPKLPIFLRQLTWVDCRDGFSPDCIDELYRGITHKSPPETPQTRDPPTWQRRAVLALLPLAIVCAAVGLIVYLLVWSGEGENRLLPEGENLEVTEFDFNELINQINQRKLDSDAAVDRFLGQYLGTRIRLTSVYIVGTAPNGPTYIISPTEEGLELSDSIHLASFSKSGGFLADPPTGPKSIEGTMKKPMMGNLIFEDCRFVNINADNGDADN